MLQVKIIAEAGVNHNGSLALAKELIDVAVEAKVDYVKFQSYKSESLVTGSAKKAAYQAINTADYQVSQLEMLKRYELSREAHHELLAYCQKKQVAFMSSAFDLESIELLAALKLELLKIPSSEVTNYPYLQKIGALGSRLILSSGMSYLHEVAAALAVLEAAGTPRQKICVLHCNTHYPTPYSDVNLKAMLTIRDALQVEVGYSDHTLGNEVAIAAVALGAKVIEKHFTLDKALPGPDHKASLDPVELKSFVEALRHTELALGSREKVPTLSEKANMQAARKSIVAKIPISVGELFSCDNLTVKRPGTGINPMQWQDLLGQRAERNYQVDELIENSANRQGSDVAVVLKNALSGGLCD